MNWREFVEINKKNLLIVLLPVLLIVSILLLRACDQSSKPDDGQGNSNPVVRDDETYVPKVTYQIRLAENDEDPAVFSLDASPSGKAYIPTQVNDMENVVWSGWLTEDGQPFDFDTVLTQDLTLYCIYWDDQNNNNIIDGSASDPITIYEFWHNDFKMLSRTIFGKDAELDYSAPEYNFPQSENDGYVFLGWTVSESVTDGGKTTVILTPELAADRNDNGLADGSADDPYEYHIFLDQDGEVLEEIRRLAGGEEVRTEDVACPTTTKQKLIGWERSESINEEGNVVYTYTPNIIEQ